MEVGGSTPGSVKAVEEHKEWHDRPITGATYPSKKIQFMPVKLKMK
jgi:hypothetical protein